MSVTELHSDDAVDLTVIVRPAIGNGHAHQREFAGVHWYTKGNWLVITLPETDRPNRIWLPIGLVTEIREK